MSRILSVVGLLFVSLGAEAQESPPPSVKLVVKVGGI